MVKMIKHRSEANFTFILKAKPHKKYRIIFGGNKKGCIFAAIK